MDPNADPEKATVPVAGNDDAIRAVKLITQTIADAVLEGKARIPEKTEGKGVPALKGKVPEKKKEAAEAASPKEKDQPRRSRPRHRPRKKKPAEVVRIAEKPASKTK